MNRRHFIATSAAAFTLVGCSSGPVPRDMFYRLTGLAPAAPLAGGAIKGTIEVPPFRATGIVNERAILYREGPRALSQYSYHTWSDPPASMMQQAFIDALRGAQAFTLVGAPTMKLDRDFELVGTIHQLEHVVVSGSSNVVIELEVAVRRVRDNKVLIAKTYRGEAPAPADDIDATVAAFTKAMDKILADFLGDLGSVPKEIPAA